jgi:hypothetical protein
MFYTFHQVNSGGRFRDPAIYVVIEASSAEEANELAIERAGLYFDGVRNGRDCGCCGDRWYRQEELFDEATELPTIYDELLDLENPPEDDWHAEVAKRDKVPYAKVYYKNGDIRTVQ